MSIRAVLPAIVLPLFAGDAPARAGDRPAPARRDGDTDDRGAPARAVDGVGGVARARRRHERQHGDHRRPAPVLGRRRGRRGRAHALRARRGARWRAARAGPAPRAARLQDRLPLRRRARDHRLRLARPTPGGTRRARPSTSSSRASRRRRWRRTCAGCRAWAWASTRTRARSTGSTSTCGSRAYHWLDASPPGVTWKERQLRDPGQTKRDAAWTPADNLPL